MVLQKQSYLCIHTHKYTHIRIQRDRMKDRRSRWLPDYSPRRVLHCRHEKSCLATLYVCKCTFSFASFPLFLFTESIYLIYALTNICSLWSPLSTPSKSLSPLLFKRRDEAKGARVFLLFLYCLCHHMWQVEVVHLLGMWGVALKSLRKSWSFNTLVDV